MNATGTGGRWPLKYHKLFEDQQATSGNGFEEASEISQIIREHQTNSGRFRRRPLKYNKLLDYSTEILGLLGGGLAIPQILEVIRQLLRVAGKFWVEPPYI